MAPFQSRFQRKTAISVGALMVLLVLYTAFLLHSLYARNISNVQPKIDTSRLSLSCPNHSPNLPSSSDNRPQVLDVPDSNYPLENKDQDQNPKPNLTQPTLLEDSTTSHHHWAFNVTKDERAYGLSPEQCDASFPSLFADIDRAVALRKGVGKYTADDIDISWKEYGAVRVAIVDQQVKECRDSAYSHIFQVLTTCFP
jgi:hypothetical protein